MNLHWLLRMARWAHHPPSPGPVRFVLAVAAICILLWAIGSIWGWPAALTVNGGGPRLYRP